MKTGKENAVLFTRSSLMVGEIWPSFNELFGFS